MLCLRFEEKVQISCVDSVQFDLSTIQVATDNFSNAKRLGKGSATRVYKVLVIWQSK